MYKISVPVINMQIKRAGRDAILKNLKELNAERVFLALNQYETDPQKRQEVFKELKENCDFFKFHGFEVGTWVWTFG